MKITDLRIGNLVYILNYKETFKIDYIDGYDNLLSVEECEEGENLRIEDLKGITLTEEWLLKLGFKPFCKDFAKDGIIIHTRKRGFVIRKSIPIMQFVHQLQNFYFTNTGKELEVTI